MKLEQALEKERFMTTILAGGPGSGRKPGGGSGEEDDYGTIEGKPNSTYHKVGPYGLAIARGEVGEAYAGHHGMAVVKGGGLVEAGHRGVAKAGNNGTARAGNYGNATTGRAGYAHAGKNGHAHAGLGGSAQAGKGGKISIDYRNPDSSDIRTKSGLIGKESGLRANTMYMVNKSGKFYKDMNY
ncbi:MAG: hypothetical protein KGN01_06180 [Patescibacteria group bacterium]|nr:hypothetical protein [Patescibacteria group bacterium]